MKIEKSDLYYFPFRESELGERQISVLRNAFAGTVQGPYRFEPITREEVQNVELLSLMVNANEKPTKRQIKYTKDATTRALKSLTGRGFLKSSDFATYELTDSGALEIARNWLRGYFGGHYLQKAHPNKYPKNWDAISYQVRDEANWVCEWCGIHNGSINPLTGGRVTLTVAHMNHNKPDCSRENLKALCNACHLGYDRDRHAAKRKRGRKGKYVPGDGYEGVLKLF